MFQHLVPFPRVGYKINVWFVSEHPIMSMVMADESKKIYEKIKKNPPKGSWTLDVVLL